MDKRDRQIIEYINNIKDKNSPIFKTIGYYLNDEKYVEELKDYFNSRLSLICLVLIILMNILIIGEIIFIILSQYVLLLKFLLAALFLAIDCILIIKYKNYLSVSYKYRLMYLFIESIPLEILKKVYNRITSKDYECK
ncbi:hypothetical protein H6A03_09055 [[Clostridium] spiroforme]|nr:hypothetical protein [Thomasclavelia spiroformis]MBM6880777.1 hypothetical protein [Thomasclavelia spiroformis]MBM6931194.1 hypothetical protein [Thomasclavelia spiroformis]